MAIEATKTVGQLAAELSGAARVFEKNGIDYCCGGQRTLEEACQKANVPVAEVLRSLEAAEASLPNDTDWQQATLTALIAHIVGRHHSYVREELPRLGALLTKVCGVHGQNHPELLQVRRSFRGLEQELTMHMMKEEQILFPYIVELDEAKRNNGYRPAPVFGTVQNPVRMMIAEHDAAGELLRQMRDSTRNFTLPEDGCASYRALYQGLTEFEADLHQHIHLENNVLFPRAVEMEARG